MIKQYTVNIIFWAKVLTELTTLWVFGWILQLTKEEVQACVRQSVVKHKELDCKELSRKGLKDLQVWIVDNKVPRNCKFHLDIEMVIEGNLEQGK